MQSNELLPIVTTTRLAETRAFYVEHLGLELTYDSPFYLGVRAGAEGAPQLGFMTPDADAPEAFDGRGLTLSVRVADADREHARLCAAGVAVAGPPEDRPWGVRGFALSDPNGVMLFVGHPILAQPEFAAYVR